MADFYGDLRFYVYGYFMPGDYGDGLGEPLYIGKGQGRRLSEHLRPSQLRSNPEFHQFVQLLKWQRLAPEVQIISDWLTEQQAYDFEQFLVTRFGRRDIGTGCLFNKCDGGNGGLSIGYRHSPEMVERIREATKARWRDPEMRAKIKRRMKGKNTGKTRPYKALPHLKGRRPSTRPRIIPSRHRWQVLFGGNYICTRDLYCEAVKAVAEILAGRAVERKPRARYFKASR